MAGSADALAQLQTAQSTALTPEQATAQANQANGVDAAQQTVTGLRGAIQHTTSLLNNVAPSVYGRTGGSLVTDAQATRQIGNEQAPIQTDLAKDTQDYTDANADAQTAEQKAEKQADDTITGQNSRLSYLQGIYQDLYGQEQDQAKAAEQAKQDAEQQREFNATPHGTATSGLDLSGLEQLLGGGASGSSAAGSYTRDSVGGYAVKDASGKPITLAQYVDTNGGGVSDVLSLLAKGSAGDQKTAQIISSGLKSNKFGTGNQISTNLSRLYPQIFGG